MGYWPLGITVRIYLFFQAGTYTELMANEGLFAEYVKTHRADENNQDKTGTSFIHIQNI